MSGSAVREPSKAIVVGYVEALNRQAALGWVWCPGHADRLRVELRLGDEVLAQALADLSRDDLAKSGIGDGRHAFTLTVPEHVSARLADLRVLAFPIEGQAVALDPPPAAPPASESLAPLQRGIETLISSQRLLHRNLQAALLQQGPSATAMLADVAAAQSKLGDAIATVELFVVRLETAIQGPERTVASASAPPRRILAASFVISSLAFIVSCWAVYRVVINGQ